jgi:hypothetical protein
MFAHSCEHTGGSLVGAVTRIAARPHTHSRTVFWRSVMWARLHVATTSAHGGRAVVVVLVHSGTLHGIRRVSRGGYFSPTSQAITPGACSVGGITRAPSGLSV